MDYRKQGFIANTVKTFESVCSDIASLILPGLMGGIVLLLSIFFQEVWHLSAFHAGLTFLALGAAIGFTSPLAALLLARAGWVGALLISCAGVSIGLCLVAISVLEVKEGFSIILALVVLGMGFACFFVTSAIGATAHVPAARQGIASGILGTAQQLGTSLGVGILPLIAASGTGPDSFFGRGIASAALVGALMSILVGLVIYGIKRVHSHMCVPHIS